MEYFQFVTNNKQSLKKSSECACVYCFEKFDPNNIMEWCGYDEDTAICPHCGINTVVPKFLINYTDDLLNRWHEQGFDPNKTISYILPLKIASLRPK